MTAQPGGLDELRGEPLDPAVNGDVIDGDAALGQQLLDIPVGQPALLHWLIGGHDRAR